MPATLHRSNKWTIEVYTQQNLADLCGVTKQSIWQWLRKHPDIVPEFHLDVARGINLYSAKQAQQIQKAYLG